MKQYRGFALPTYTGEGYEDEATLRSIRQIAATGAEWVQLNPTLYQDSVHSSALAKSDTTPSDSSLETSIQAAHETGLKVMLKPHVDVTDGSTRTQIRPSDEPGWFESYEEFISRYAELAARTGTETLVLGTELRGLSANRDQWWRIAQEVRARYAGPITYAANYDEYQGVPFWQALDFVGVDAYFPVSGSPTADVAALEMAWLPIRAELAAFSERTGKRVLFTEVGYTSQHGTTTAPYSWTVSEQPDQSEQAAAYDALLTAFSNEAWWAGVIWWCWDVPFADESLRRVGYTVQGKAAEDVVRQWWR